jgi:hypothetical protein
MLKYFQNDKILKKNIVNNGLLNENQLIALIFLSTVFSTSIL